MKMNEKTIFLEKIIGSNAKVRILSFLYNFSDLDYSIAAVASECKISWNTSRKDLQNFHSIGLVRITRIKGNQTYYKAIKNEIYTAFIELENRVTDKFKLGDKDRKNL